MDLKEEDILGAGIGGHWYYRSKAAALRRAVGSLAPKRLLDVGAGSGFFSRHLLERTPAESALCVDIGYAADRDDRVAGKPVRFRRDDDIAARRELEAMLDALSREQTIQVARAFSYFSHLANIAEDRHHVRRRQHHERQGHQQDGSLALRFEARRGVFFAEHYEHHFPICPNDYGLLLQGDDLLDSTSAAALKALADQFTTLHDQSDAYARAGALKLALKALAENPAIGRCIAANLARHDGRQPEGFARLHSLLERQSYRLASWRTAADDINWRRFFDVNELGGLRVGVVKADKQHRDHPRQQQQLCPSQRRAGEREPAGQHGGTGKTEQAFGRHRGAQWWRAR